MAAAKRKLSSTSLHREMLAAFRQAPRQYLRAKLGKLIASKVPSAPPGFADAYAEHLVTDTDAPFVYANDSEPEIDVEISQEEADGLLEDATRFVTEEMPGIMRGVIESSAKDLLRRLIADWPAQRSWERETRQVFQERLEERWGRGFDILRMLYTIAQEMGGEAHQRAKRSRAKKNRVLRDTLIQLHVRACQVVAEIICLVENGFADGAMARWRTLHEIAIVAAVIAKHGEALAERYRAHEYVEAKRAMDRFRVSHAALGYRPPSVRSIAKVERDYEAMLVRYGHTFGSEYGWAANHLGQKKPRFVDLLAEAGKLEMRSYYAMASYNVHASPKGIAFRLGILKGPGQPVGLSGASNVGFVEPAQNAAFDLVFITSLVIGPVPRFDQAIELNLLVLLRNRISVELGKSHRVIVRAHNALTRLTPVGESRRKARAPRRKTDTSSISGN